MTAQNETSARLPEEALDFMRARGTHKLLAVLNQGGEEARIVGGAVRNALLGRPVTEIDVATTALPQTVTTRALAAGFKAIPTGIEHGTITVVIDREPFEVTTLRADIDTDGRHAKVRFGRSFAEDALRRDFTINALSASAEGKVFDYVGGLDDLAARRVRFIGAPAQRIAEDYLRILRFFRFHALYGAGPLDRDGFDAALRARAGLARLSRERVATELMKLVAAPGAPDVVASVSDAGLLEPLLGGIAIPARLRRVAAIEAHRSLRPGPVLRLAALAVLIVEDAQRLRDALRLSNEDSKRLAEAAGLLEHLHGRAEPPEPDEIRELLVLNGRAATCDALVLAHAESAASAHDGAWTAAHEFASATPLPRMPVTGADILARGIPSGPKVGEILKTLQARWIRAGFPREPSVLAELIEAAITATRSQG